MLTRLLAVIGGVSLLFIVVVCGGLMFNGPGKPRPAETEPARQAIQGPGAEDLWYASAMYLENVNRAKYMAELRAIASRYPNTQCGAIASDLAYAMSNYPDRSFFDQVRVIKDKAFTEVEAVKARNKAR